MHRLLLTSMFLFTFAGIASAQLTQAKNNRIVFGHVHLHPTSVDAHKKFWIETLGGIATKIGSLEAVKFPDGVVELGSPSFGETKPAGGTKTSTVDHVGFTVPNVRAMVDRVKSAGFAVITR